MLGITASSGSGGRRPTGSIRRTTAPPTIPGPTIPEPAGLNRERWDALVFNAWEGWRYDQTIVIARDVVPTVNVCIQSPDVSRTGERLVPYSDAAWWRRQIDRWTGVRWSGEIRIAACTGTGSDGWIYVREGAAGEVRSGATAQVNSHIGGSPHMASWRRSTIAWNPD